MNRVGLSGTGDGKASGGGERRDEKKSKITTGQKGWSNNLNKFQGRVRFTSQ